MRPRYETRRPISSAKRHLVNLNCSHPNVRSQKFPSLVLILLVNQCLGSYVSKNPGDLCLFFPIKELTSQEGEGAVFSALVWWLFASSHSLLQNVTGYIWTRVGASLHWASLSFASWHRMVLKREWPHFICIVSFVWHIAIWCSWRAVILGFVVSRVSGRWLWSLALALCGTDRRISVVFWYMCGCLW